VLPLAKLGVWECRAKAQAICGGMQNIVVKWLTILLRVEQERSF